MKKYGIGLAVLIVGALALFFFWNKDAAVSTESGHQNTVTNGALEGTVIFHSDGKERKVEVEIARSSYELAKGLMDRTTLPHNQGMLFIFEEMAPRSFWMRNTRISLDIIYVDDKKKVVSIQKNAIPQSDESLPSSGPAQYVVEVNAGFCDTYNIQPGDSLTFLIP
jgi:uncharacterized membrane protein (UPF0127 family)